MEGDVKHEDCFHEDDFKRLEGLVEKVFSRMDTFLSEMRELMIAEARRQEQVSNLQQEIVFLRASFKSDTDALGGKHRFLLERVQTIHDWKQRFEGGVKVMMAIPVLCTIITTSVAIYTMMGI